ncbi:MAG: hypothetical protein HFH68_00170 [Lachnospiraceae bacterium]|nr:hypothetical protein [Lachnospiraceae bacterium]
MFGGISSVFSSNKNTVTNEHIQILRNWNNAVKHGCTNQETFNKIIANTDENTKAYFTGLNRGKASIEGLINVQNNMTASSKAATIALKGLALAGNMLFAWGITKLISGIHEFATASESIRESAKETGTSFSDTKSDIESYKTKIQELQDTINDSSSSISDVTESRRSLMGIQDELIGKYGTETETIQAVTSAINDQADALDILSGKKYQESVNTFNGQNGFWQNLSNTFSGYSNNMDRMVAEMEEPIVLNLISAANRNMEEYKKFEKAISQYGTIGTGNEYAGGNGIAPLAIELSGGMDNIYEKLLKIQKIASDYDFGSDNFAKMLTDEINESKDKLDKYSELYDGYVLNEKILSRSGSQKGYDNIFENINNAMESYQKAKLDGSNKEIQKAGENYASVLSEELSKIAPDDENVKTYLENLYPEMQEIVGTWELEYSLKSDGKEKEKLKEALDKFEGTNEIKGYNPDASNDEDKNEAYAFLEGYAGKYKLETDQLIDKAQELGLVQNENYNQLVELFGQYNISKLAPDDLGIAYKIENIGGITFEELQEKIEETKQKSKEAAIVSFSEAWKELKNATGDDYKNLVPDLLELSNTGTLTPETLKSVENYNTLLEKTGLTAEEAVKEIYKLKDTDFTSMLASMREGISSISDILATKKDNLSDKKTKTQGIGADTLASMPEEVKKCRKEYQKFVNILGDGSSSMDECQKAADNLATAYVNSNYFLEKLNDSNKDAAISMLEEMGIVNADQVVMEALARKKAEAWVATQDFTNMTGAEIAELINEQGALDGTTKALQLYALNKLWANGNALDTQADLDNLIAFVKGLGLSAKALETYRNAKAGFKIPQAPGQDLVNQFLNGNISGKDLVNIKNDDPVLKSNATNEINGILADLGNVSASISPKGPGYAGKNSNGSGKDKGSSSKTRETKQEIDWLQRAIDVTTNKIDFLKAKLENIFAVKKSNRVLKDQINETGSLIANLGKKVRKYWKEANQNKLSSKLKNQVRKGKVKSGHNELVQKYGEKKAGLIESYKESLSKYESARDKKKEAVNKKKSLQQELDINNGKSGKYLKKYTNQIKSSRKKAKRYKKKADNVKLSARLKKQVRNGQINGSRKQLAKTYGKSKTKKIKKYGNNYTKYQAAIKAKNKAVKNKKAVKEQAISNSTLEKRNTNLGQQIKLSKKLEKMYAKAEKTYATKAGSVKLDEKLKELVHNGQVKGSHKELVRQYGEKTADKIEKYKDYYEKSQKAKKSRQETKTQTRELKEQQHQNRIDDADARIEKLNAQAENKTKASGKNQYLEKSVKWTKISYNQQIKIAQLEKDSVKAAQLKAEKKKALLDIEIQQHQNLQDEYDSYVSLYSVEAESGKTAKDKEASLKEQIKYTKKSYKEQINIAKAEGNAALKKQLQIEKQQELLSLDTQILQNYADEHNASATLANTQAKVAASAKEKNEFGHKALENEIQEYKYLYQIAKLKGDITEMARLEAGIQSTANESAKTQMDNIATEYQKKLDEIDRKTSFINHQVSLVEAKNGFITAEMYEETVKSEKEHLEMLKQEKTGLEENFKNVGIGSDQWYEMRNIIYSVDEAIQNTNESITGNTQKIREAKRELEDLGRGVIDNLDEEADFYEKILSYKDMFDNETGLITREGSSTLALHAFKATDGITQSQIIQEQLRQLDKDYISGTNSMSFNDYYERRDELVKQQRSYIEGCYEEMEAIKELCSEGYEKQKEAMEKLVDKYKKTLQAEKNLRDYQNKIADKTADIASIKKQIAALKGNMTEEARAKMQKLTVQLNDAEKDLEETEYEKYISDQEEILDNMLVEFENFIDRQLADMEWLVEKVIKAMPASTSVVNNTLNEIADMWGITLSEALDSSTLSGSYSTIADKTSETATIADSIYKAITGNYDAIGSALTFLSVNTQQMLLWLNTHNFTTDIEEAIKNTKDYQPEKYETIPNDKPDITDPATENTWDNGSNTILDKIKKLVESKGQKAYGSDQAGNDWSKRVYKDGLSLMLLENTGKVLDDSYLTVLAELLDIDTGDWTSENTVKALKGYNYNGGIYAEFRNTIAEGLASQLGWNKHTTEVHQIQGSAAMGNYVQNQMESADNGTNGMKTKAINFINSNLRTPEGSETMALRYDPLNSYIYSKTNKILTDAGHAETLAKILGVSTAQDGWRQIAADDLKSIGYSEGGIAEILKTVPGRTGDDGWCVVQKGEAILNLEQTEMFKDLITKLPELTRTTDIVPAALKTPSYNTAINNDNSISMGSMVFNIDGSNIHDLESLKKEIQHDNKFRNFMTDVVLGKVTGNNYAHMKY